MTRSRDKVAELPALGAEPVGLRCVDAVTLTDAVSAFEPDAVVHQLTDLPDRLEQLAQYATRNDRMRSEGTRNLIAAAKAAGASHFLAQSIAWRPEGRAEIVDQHERQVLEFGGVVVRYGRLYGPGTFYERERPPQPRIHIDSAARRTLPLLGAPSGIITITDPP
jgi:hypothetical protein